jgi:transcriptional regulator with XRE-family HTH domain
MDLGAAIRSARKGRGLTQVKLAQLIGVSRHTILALEVGAGSVAVLERAASVVSFRITGLAGGNTIGEQLQAARAQRGLTQADVASRSEVSIPTVRALERGGGSVRTLEAVLRVLGPRAHANANFTAHYQLRRDVRFTPPDFLAEIELSFGRISIDVAGDPRSYVSADRILTEREDGLTTRWSGDLVWCNPPYSSLSTWIARCADAWDQKEVGSIIGLFPARTETVAFRTRVLGVADVVLLPRRLRFHDEDRQRLAPAPFALMLVCWGLRRDVVQAYATRTEAHVIWASTAGQGA